MRRICGPWIDAGSLDALSRFRLSVVAPSLSGCAEKFLYRGVEDSSLRSE
jgi:hypothetical protein